MSEDIDAIIDLAPPGRLMMFIQYDHPEPAYKRAFFCLDKFPDYRFTVGKYNGKWAVAVLKPE